SRRRHTRSKRDWSSDVCSSDLKEIQRIYNIFHKLKSEKQQRIINAAFKEFEQNGFDKASTNEIVKDATISKGALFHYFNNKKDLYIYLIDYSIQIIEKLYDKIDFDETDLFKRIEKIGLKKLHIQ